MTETAHDLFDGLTTPYLADACLRLKIPMRVAPVGIKSALPNQRVAGRACPVRHYGSVDVFLEALESAQAGDVLVIDNDGRLDEACVGDLIALEAQKAGLAGIVIWGLHRDSDEIAEIGLPLFSYGTNPAGPQRLDSWDDQPFDAVRFGENVVYQSDVVVGDSDGVLFIEQRRLDEIIPFARALRDKEQGQAALARAGQSLRDQLRFAEYMCLRAADPTYTFRRHLRHLDGAIEE